MWVMIIKKLSIQNPPPRCSIHWAKNYDNLDRETKQFRGLFSFSSYLTEAHQNIAYALMKYLCKGKEPYLKDYDISDITKNNVNSFYEQHREKIREFLADKDLYDPMWMGLEPNYFGAKRIVFEEEEFVIFPHEYSIVSLENMHIYMEDSHELVPGNTAEKRFIRDNLSKGQRRIYDASLVDGCNHRQAILNVMGKPIDDFPEPIGWYKMKPEYQAYFGV